MHGAVFAATVRTLWRIEMRTHQKIDERSLALAQAVAERIDRDPQREGLLLARENCARWLQKEASPAILEWQRLLGQDWESVRKVLLDEGQLGQRLRQSTPFCGILTPRERWEIYRRFSNEKT
jgi:hypothetical protein